MILNLEDPRAYGLIVRWSCADLAKTRPAIYTLGQIAETDDPHKVISLYDGKAAYCFFSHNLHRVLGCLRWLQHCYVLGTNRLYGGLAWICPGRDGFDYKIAIGDDPAHH